MWSNQGMSLDQSNLPPAVLAKHRDRVERFVLRARRIEAHSLTQDRLRLLPWAQGTLRGGRDGSGTWDLPPEEAFESLAARVRPLLLDNDGIKADSVIGSMKSFVRGDERRMGEAVALRGEWDKILKPDDPASLARFDQSMNTRLATYDQVAVADAWLYGDLVHAVGQEPDMASIQMRYVFAVKVLTHVAM